MDILNKPINTFSFEDIEKFCQEGHGEGIQLDYKKDLSKKGLAKHFAAFSNARGGIIIIGVEEDKKTSAPITWVGVKNEGKLEERVHQFASSVEPFPQYEVSITNEKNSNVFILIRIFEGDRTPYYVQNDSTLWIRTGNITSLIDKASPDETELLVGKKKKAEKTRKTNLIMAKEIYDVALKRAESNRFKLVAEEKEKFRKEQQEENAKTGATTIKFKPTVCQNDLGTQASMCTITIQPFYPQKLLCTPEEIKNSIDKFRFISNTFRDFPSLNMERIPYGILNFEWSQSNGAIECQQVYSNGLLYLSIDILRINEEGRQLWISLIVGKLFILLKTAKNYYNLFGYQGGLVGYLSIENVEQVKVHTLIPRGWNNLFGETIGCLLPKYRWEFELDTSLLNDDKAFQEYFIDKIKEIYWHLGYGAAKDELYKDYLKEQGWLIE